MSAGYNGRISELYKKSQVLYVVRIGYYNTAQEAEYVGDQIKSNLDLNTIVVIN